MIVVSPVTHDSHVVAQRFQLWLLAKDLLKQRTCFLVLLKREIGDTKLIEDGQVGGVLLTSLFEVLDG